MHEYVSVMHIHTLHSDGFYDVDRIAREGSVSGIDIVFITDHARNVVGQFGKEGWYKDVLVLSGYEVNDPQDKNHYLVFDHEPCVDGKMGAHAYVRKVAEEGGLGFIAHPDERRDHYHQHPPYNWTDLDVEGFTGIEIWNYMSEWMEELKPGRRLLNLLFPDRTIHGPTDMVLEFLDEIGRKRPIVAVGSADAHCHQYKLLGFTVSIFPYRMLFRRIRTHLLLPERLTGDLESDRLTVYGALAQGRAFIANRRVGDARGFSFFAVSGNDKIWMGGETGMDMKPALRVEVPASGEISLLRNGKIERTEKGRVLTFSPEQAGFYRVEVRRRGKPWIFSNGIRVL